MSPYYVGARLRVKGDESGARYTIVTIGDGGLLFVLEGVDGYRFLINIEAVNVLLVVVE